ncbi:hypothetical protein [Arthrobacter sp. B0490]|uniref:hypothetical protein n=1 Tax=Arthrobacter sp. B0490 TaxID=2058891 RepID=UPI0015E4084B|nr:hypothetical protein [Arthrobacter sp. B0490]
MQQGSRWCARFYRIAAVEFRGQFLVAKRRFRVRFPLRDVSGGELALELTVKDLNLGKLKCCEVLGEGLGRGKTCVHEAPITRTKQGNDQARF